MTKEHGSTNGNVASTRSKLGTQERAFHRVCSLDVHDASSSKADILVNLSSIGPGTFLEGDLLQISAFDSNSHLANGPGSTANISNAGQEKPRRPSLDDSDDQNGYIFRIKAMPPELLARQPHWEVSVSTQTLHAFRLMRGGKVMLSSVDEESCRASHVEIIFRDQYLTRADMWRLVNSELAGKCLHRGQKIVFMETIRATVRTIFLAGTKTHSALFHSSTKPIFRSESARYVLFIQMSKEMWNFDAEGTGEIMFDKVINGFLPELFKRWQHLQVRHLVTIVLFTRMIYDEPKIVSNIDAAAPRHVDRPSQDFYRVVVSDMASADSANILQQLKKEFKVFLRDVSIEKPDGKENTEEHCTEGSTNPTHVIAGRPSVASQGNVLEAINLASSQFSADYIDRDLVRTGVSIVVISPGTGLFNVDYDLLVATTDTLVDNGVGIDLVCLSRMPLHSVPLFRYKQPSPSGTNKPSIGLQNQSAASYNSSVSQGLGTLSPYSQSFGSARHLNEWRCGIPHWIDVSFWTSAESDHEVQLKKTPNVKTEHKTGPPQHKTFIPRVKMYDLQMMGAMDALDTEILIPPLPFSQSSFSALGEMTESSLITENNLSVSPRGSIHRTVAINTSNGIGFATSPKSNKSRIPKIGNNVFDKMDDYDELLFSHPRALRKRRARIRPKHRLHTESKNSLRPERSQPNKLSSKPWAASVDQGQGKAFSKDMAIIGTGGKVDHQFDKHKSTALKSGQIPRTSSLGLRPLTPQAVVHAIVDNTSSTEWNTRKARLVSADIQPGHATVAVTTPGLQDATESMMSTLRPSSDTDSGVIPSSDSEHQGSSRPIPIRSTPVKRVMHRMKSIKDSAFQSHEFIGAERGNDLTDPQESTIPVPEHEVRNENVKVLEQVLSSSTMLAPWLTILNPSNPTKLIASRSKLLGRWQHIFPRPPKVSQIKWKSLCAPAAVPITSEDFPTSDQLEEEYRKSSYLITLPEEMDLSEDPRSIVNEILAFRLARGFQITIADEPPSAALAASTPGWDIFNDRTLTDVGSTIRLSRGTTIHRLSRTGIDRLEIEVFTRHSVAKTIFKQEEKPMMYTPLIRSMLANTYEPQSIPLAPQRGSFNWDIIDAFIAGHERPEAAQYVEKLRPWRARFVLIPVEPPSSAKRMLRSNEDSEEEIRLEGIKRLTQLWQRFRYLHPEERHFQGQLRRSKDPNPLDITYQTKDPSAIVAAELEASLEGNEVNAPLQLLPEPELYQRANLSLKTLADTLQSEKGVRIYNRRWHWRLHYNCFTGLDLTTWILQNFRDVETREEAEQLGKDLMKKGLFRHVDTRHDFRDGNYFYQIADDYRTARSESKGWFSRSKSSVPPTPTAGDPPVMDLPIPTRSRASSNADASPESRTSTPLEKKQKMSIALSKSLFYDVDHRKRSYRPELINLHYDRLHNPDSCYHIRVEWMNTTPRLIQEAVVSWATQVDRFGLRLVEVPIGEASSITSMHPFRAPYQITLCRTPPTKQPQSYADVPPLTQQSRIDTMFYQKAILKHHNFVLDYEAASSFPADVDVSYSWGKPDYQYPQYIHRSGALIAQITDEGHFLILANRLYNNRSTSHGSDRDAAARERLAEHGPMWSPHRGGPATQISPHLSPLASPSVRAVLNVPPPSAARRSPAASSSSPSSFARPATPEQITREFQSFCNDASRLEAFYAEVLSKVTTPASTPRMGGKTPLRTPLKTPSRLADKSGANGEGLGEIPSLALPGSVVEGKTAEEKEKVKKRMK